MSDDDEQGTAEAEAPTEPAGDRPTPERVDRWRVGLVAALGLVGLGFLYASPLLLATTVVPLTYVVYGALSSVPGDANVRVERRFDDPTPAPGQRVSVALTVENVGESALSDLRVVDGVPDELAVVAGSPRGAFALRPGESRTLTYEVVARRGEFAFRPAAVRLRSLSAAHRLTDAVSAAGDASLACVAPLSDVGLDDATLSRAGTHPTDSGGEGVEFRSTREYQPGDPITRINWRQFAKTGELSTVSFREERAVRTVLIVDARPPGRVTPRPGSPTGTELCGYASERLYGALADGDVVTSVTAVGLDDAETPLPRGAGGLPWADGDDGDATALARRLFVAVQRVADDAASTGADARPGTPSGRPPEPGAQTQGDGEESEPEGAVSESRPTASTDGGPYRTRAIVAGLPPTARVVLATPLTDDWPLSLVRTLEERGYPVTVVSPDVTGTGSLGGAVVGMERRRRLREAATAGAQTVDWNPAEPIDAALAESLDTLRSTDT